jgi:hypothetical protein
MSHQLSAIAHRSPGMISHKSVIVSHRFDQSSISHRHQPVMVISHSSINPKL